MELHAQDELFDKNPFAYFMVRTGGAVVRVNARFQAATGYTTDDLAGRPFEDLLARGDAQEIHGYHREKLRYRDRTFEYECNVTRKDGQEIRAVITMNIVVQGGFGLGALRDVTEERRLSRELSARNDELLRTATMLRAAQEELQRATQLATLGEVGGRVAHEILNPLTAVVAKVTRLDARAARLIELADAVRGEASAELMRAVAEALDEQHAAEKKDLAFIAGELQRIHRLVHDLRGATRPAALRAKVSLTDLLDYCGEVMSVALERSRTEYRCSCPDDVWLFVDRGEIVQALTNVMRNAVEAHEEAPAPAERLLSVTAEARGELATIRVVDGGAGVPEEIAAQIFEPAFTTKPTGTGLGLAIARRLVRAHGGDVVLAPRDPVRGATFVVTLPCAIEPRAGWEG